MVRNSIIFPNVHICEGAILDKTIVGEGTIIGKGVVSGMNTIKDNPYSSKLINNDIVLIGGNIRIEDGSEISKNSIVRAGVTIGGDNL